MHYVDAWTRVAETAFRLMSDLNHERCLDESQLHDILCDSV